MVLRLPVQIVGGGYGELLHSGKTLLRRRVPDLHELLWLREGKRPQQHSIYHAENRGIRADAKCQYQ